MEKTLYLSEKQTLRIRCDGPSLWVEQANCAGQRVPARLVRRAIVVGNVTLDSGTLTLLAQRGVPIALLDRRGEPLD
jgi:CRISPR/Cas system-associated endonuclease Cas1